MSKDTVQSWDVVADNNSDIGGINIAEGCPAAGVNNAERTIMAQIATWILSLTGPLLKTGGALTGDVTTTGKITGMATGSTVKDSVGAERFIGYRSVPLTAQTSAYVLALTDVGQLVSITTGGVTVPANATIAFVIGDCIAVFNNSGSSQTLTQASGVTLRLSGTTTTGNRTLAPYGVAGLIKVGTNEWVAGGMGVT